MMVNANAPERNRSVGIRVELPFEQEVNPFVEQAFEHKTFFTRLHRDEILAADAVLLCVQLEDADVESARRTGAPLSSMGISRPSLLRRSV